MSAIVTDYSIDTLCVRISKPDGSDFGASLLEAGVAVRQEEPFCGSLVAVTSHSGVSSPTQPPQSSQQPEPESQSPVATTPSNNGNNQPNLTVSVIR